MLSFKNDTTSLPPKLFMNVINGVKVRRICDIAPHTYGETKGKRREARIMHEQWFPIRRIRSHPIFSSGDRWMRETD
ncbi:hypothetical protein TNCT_84681 [Trichonephila clavata]|uniref:Uncharacterized protein n=1 Tax=Trichonephila clavata TaxID=2740835 RepID=A0A8X6K7A0_TRICU|nr:hypothetical protein TNCT_84681 [Trichonephila clavata]